MIKETVRGITTEPAGPHASALFSRTALLKHRYFGGTVKHSEARKAPRMAYSQDGVFSL